MLAFLIKTKQHFIFELEIHYIKDEIQANPDMSNLLILNTWLMLKCSYIPEYFPYIALLILVYVEFGQHKHENSAMWKTFFIREK